MKTEITIGLCRGAIRNSITTGLSHRKFDGTKAIMHQETGASFSQVLRQIADHIEGATAGTFGTDKEMPEGK